MKRIALALIAMWFASCSIIKDYQPAYISAVEVMNNHKLNSKEIRAMRRAARNGEIACYYHAGRDCWVYDASYDYKKFKMR